MSYRKLAVGLSLVLALSFPAAAASASPAVANGRLLIDSGTTDTRVLLGLTPGHQTMFFGSDTRFFTGAYSPDGTRIAFAAATPLGHEIYVENADGTHRRQLTHNSSDDDSPSWSPDGKKIAFTSNRDGDYDIYVMSANGSNPVNLTNAYSGDDLNPHWSPDGKSIAYDSTKWLQTRQVWEIPLATRVPRMLSLVGQDLAPEWFDSWASDGTRFIIETDRGGDWNLNEYTLDVNAPGGAIVAPLPNATKSIENLGVYSPDGTKIAFSSNRSGSFQVYTMNLDGSDLRQVTHAQNVDSFVLDWQPLHDTHAPIAHADPSVVKPGIRGALRFTAADNSGHVSADAYVLAGARPVADFEQSFAVGASATHRSFAWRAPATIKAPLKFCVVVRDPSGNESTRSCAALRVQS